MTDAVQAFLASKRTVDDRALNRRVLERFSTGLARRQRDGSGAAEPVRIVEFGAGVGTMIARLASWGHLPDRVSYRAIDRDEETVAYAREHLPTWLEDTGYEVSRRDDGLLARSGRRRLEVHLEVGDALAVTDGEAAADAVVAAAFLDVVDLETALSAVRERLAKGGLLYAPITFDGGTTFAPSHPLDERIERLYHRHMDEVRDQPGGSQAGRDLLTALPDAGYDVLATGGADWIVRPREGGYPHDEATFLESLLETIDGALADYPEIELDASSRRRWLEARRDQLERGELVLVAHHLDVLARA